jgi:anti-anti-sigma regulatory factor
MREALLDGRDLTVDLSGSTFFGTSGLNALAEALQDAEELGLRLRITGQVTRRNGCLP